LIRETALLMGGLVGVLSSASAVAAILSFRAGATLSPALQNLNQRIKA
jgi:phosphatidate cytidylyltransferase